MSISKLLLSGSTSGKQVVVSGTNSAGANTIHTAHATALDEIWLFADNDDTSDVLLTIEYGGTTDITNTIKKTIAARASSSKEDGLICVIPGLLLTGGLVVKAFAGSASKVKISGYVNRIA
jgi:hypothetical protein